MKKIAIQILVTVTILVCTHVSETCSVCLEPLGNLGQVDDSDCSELKLTPHCCTLKVCGRRKEPGLAKKNNKIQI